MAPLHEPTRQAVQREDLVINQALTEIGTNPELQSDIIEKAQTYVSENPNRVSGRVAATLAINVGTAVATRGNAQARQATGTLEGAIAGGIKGAALTTLATSGDVRQAAQNGVTDPEGFVKAFLGGEID